MSMEQLSTLEFSSQREIIFNKHLPYSDKLDVEANTILSEIKGNLGSAVQQRDIKVGANHWVGQLSRYIRLHGHKFSKEDHVYFIKLLYAITTIPDLEMSLVQKFSTMLQKLLKKHELLSRDDLTLPWKPLCELIIKIMSSKADHLGLVLFPPNIEGNLKKLVAGCRVYFSDDSTQEMLDEWRPLLCPFDVTLLKGLNLMEYFFPTKLLPESHCKGFRLWFSEVIELWESFQNTESWESSVVNLLSRLASDNIGYIDWSPYVAKIFTRIVRSFNLPVGTYSVQVTRAVNTYDIGVTATWIVSMMGGNGLVQEHIDKLFKALQSFYHPSNLGKWNPKLNRFLMELPKKLVQRLHRERYKKKNWETPVPESHKLTDKEVTEFVETLKPLVFLAMFSKYGSQDAAVALRYLSTLRPELLIPPLLEKTYPAIQTLTEPHRLIACMNCIAAVARPMLCSRKWYPEGPTHVLPLLQLCLPGIDPNDFRKSLVTFQLISTYVCLVPIVDCSEAIHVRSDLTEIEKDICSSTAQFEDFVLMFMDRAFALIENCAQDHIPHTASSVTDKLNPEQTMLEIGLASTFTSLLQQCSSAIYQSALKRLYTFITTTVYEVKVAGRFAANMCRAASRVNPEAALKLFLPYLCKNISSSLASNEEIKNEEQLDNGFMWNLLILSQVVRCDGTELVKYKDMLIEILVPVLHLKSVQGYEVAGQLLRHLLKLLTSTHSQEYRSSNNSFDKPLADYLPVRDWACPGDLHNLSISWHIPNDEELDFATEILQKVLTPELEYINSIIASKNVEREVLLQRLNILVEILTGAGSILQSWTALKPVDIMESPVSLKRFGCSCHKSRKDLTLNGQNVREVMVDTVHALLGFMLSSCEDDTKGIMKLLRVYELALYYYGVQKNDFDTRWKSFHVVKSALADELRRNKRHIRGLLVDRIQLQHELRLIHCPERVFTEKHRDIYNDLFSLAVSRYREVRKKAQEILGHGYTAFPFSDRCILPQVVTNLKNKDVEKHIFKGTLHTILGNGKKNFAVKRNWEVLCSLWPALVEANHSEELSILKLLDDIVNKVLKHLETVAIKIEVTGECLEAAKCLLQSNKPSASLMAATSEQLEAGVRFEEERNKTAERQYLTLTGDLVDLANSGSLTWKFSQMAVDFLTMLLRDDISPPPLMVQLFVRNMVHERLYIRQISVGAVGAILCQLKRKHTKILVDPYTLFHINKPNADELLFRGECDYNKDHCYDSNNLLDTEEKWQETKFIEKTHWGYYCWPKQLEIDAPSEDQPKLDRCREELSEAEKNIYDAFTSKEYVDKLVDFLSLEENKGKDKFQHKNSSLFKRLFSNFGDTYIEFFKPHIERLIKDTSHDKHESNQRCGMEILSGIIRGSKQWPYNKVEKMWNWCVPVLKDVLNSMTVETINDWGSFFTCITENRDPRKLHWLYEVLLDNPIREEGGSFADASRLHAIKNAILQQEWRVADIHNRLLSYLKPYLSYQYKNVRERISGLLSGIFLFDYYIVLPNTTRCPHRIDFITEVLPLLEELQSTDNNEDLNEMASSTDRNTNAMDVNNGDINEETEERKTAKRVCKTVMKWIISNIGKNLIPAPPEVLQMLPLMCLYESDSVDVELKDVCSVALASLSQCLLHTDTIPILFRIIRKILALKSWHARSAALSFLQVAVFCNFFSLHQPHNKEEVQDIVLNSLCDDQLEVRQMAAVTLSGLLQCGFLVMDSDMMNHFERLSGTKLKKRKNLEPVALTSLVQRHAGVLGLSACIQAYPYDVPDFMPQILMNLSHHVDDPQPIQMTVKRTLSNFRRTHHDNWHDHKQMFTDDQLVVLTDLLVSPNYYA